MRRRMERGRAEEEKKVAVQQMKLSKLDELASASTDHDAALLFP